MGGIVGLGRRGRVGGRGGGRLRGSLPRLRRVLAAAARLDARPGARASRPGAHGARGAHAVHAAAARYSACVLAGNTLTLTVPTPPTWRWVNLYSGDASVAF